MADIKQKLVQHLQDAYATENMIVEVLNGHLNDAKSVPEVATLIQNHIDETKQQAEMVKVCLQSLGAEPSGVKSTMSSVMGTIQGMMPDTKNEPLITNLKAEYTTEHFEIACYTVISTVAQQLGEQKIVETVQTIMDQEIRMAENVMQQIPKCTVLQLSQ